MKVIVVNEKDEILGYKDRSDRNSNDIIRITSIWITDGGDNILLQKRSLNKENSPGLWCPAVSGTVEEGETYEENAYKELEEEIGIKGVQLEIGKKYLYGTSRMNQLFKLHLPLDTKFTIQEDEVDRVQWFAKDELIKNYKENPDDYVRFVGVLLEDFYGEN